MQGLLQDCRRQFRYNCHKLLQANENVVELKPGGLGTLFPGIAFALEVII